MRVIVIALFVACFLSFLWGMRRFFAKPGGTVESGMVWLSRLSFLCVLVQLVEYARGRDAGLPWLGVAAAMYAGAFALYVATLLVHRKRPPSLAYSLDTPTHLVTGGPYGLVRHPFYLAYDLAWLAGFLATGSPWSLAAAVVMFVIYDRSARLEERKFASSELREPYTQYIARTGRYLPNPFKWYGARGSEGARSAQSPPRVP